MKQNARNARGSPSSWLQFFFDRPKRRGGFSLALFMSFTPSCKRFSGFWQRCKRGLLSHIHAYTFVYMQAAALLRLLGDPTRLRLLRVLAADSLNVSELTGVLGVAQSGVSRHLGLLKEAGLVAEDRAGAFTWYRLSDAFANGSGAMAPLRAWLDEEFKRGTTETR